MDDAGRNNMPLAIWKIQRPLRIAQLVLILATPGLFWASAGAFTPLICGLFGATLLIELMINLRAILFRRWLRSLDFQVCPHCAAPLKDKRNRDECPGCRRSFVMADVRKSWEKPEPFWG